MHQSRMLFIQLKNVVFQFSGTKRMRPLFTAASTFSASGFVRTNHCVETSGSTMVLQRSQLPTFSVCGSIFSSSPSFSRSATMRLRASKRSSPA